MAQTNRKVKAPMRRSYSQEFNEDAVQMLLVGHAAVWVAERLGLSGPVVGVSPRRGNLAANVLTPGLPILLALYCNIRGGRCLT
jgi:hypothetical protein